MIKIKKTFLPHYTDYSKNLYGFFILIYLYSLNWEIDPIHDGLTFPTAVAVSEGKIIFREIHSQYGLLQPSIEGFLLSISGPYLIIQRFIGSILIILISYLIYLIIKNVSNANPFLPPTLYLALTPNWNDLSTLGIPHARGIWPNSYGIFFQLLFIFLYILYLNKFQKNILFLAGASLGLSSFARIQFAVISLLILAVTLILSEKKSKIHLLLGYILTYLFTILFLTKNGAISDFYNQIIYALFDSGENSVRFPAPIPVAKMFISIFVYLIIILTLRYIFKKPKVFYVVMMLSSTIFAFVMVPLQSKESGKLASFTKLLAENIYIAPVIYLILIVIIINVRHFLMTLPNYKKTSLQSKSNKIRILLVAISFANLIQLHIFSPAYAHMIIPSYLILFTCFNLKLTRSYWIKIFKPNNYKHSYLTGIAIILSMSLLNFTYVIKNNSYTYSSKSFKFMKSYDEETYNFIEDVTAIQSKFPDQTSISINCQYGIFSLNQNGYISNSRYFWNFLPAKIALDKHKFDRASPANFLVNCEKNLQAENQLVYSGHIYKVIYTIKVNNDEYLTVSKLSVE